MITKITMTFSDTFKKLENLPSIAWVIIFPALLIGFIGSIILLFYGLSSIEGFASVIMLVAGFISFGLFSEIPNTTGYKISNNKPKATGFLIAAGICFFALMGVAVDQVGNYFYNKPLEIIFCEDGSSLKRSVDVLHPLPGRTDVVQNFTCYDENNEYVNQITIPSIIAVRFVEYVIIGYAIRFAVQQRNVWKANKKAHSGPISQ